MKPEPRYPEVLMVAERETKRISLHALPLQPSSFQIGSPTTRRISCYDVTSSSDHFCAKTPLIKDRRRAFKKFINGNSRY